MNTEANLRVLLGVLALGDPVTNAIVDLGGINTPRKLGMMREKDLADMGKTISSLTQARGGVVISNAAIRYLGGLSFWIRDKIRRGQFDETDPANFTADVCEECISKMDYETKDEKMSETVKSLHPGKVKNGKGWTQWELGFINYLTGIRGKTGVPLQYIIRKDTPVGHVFQDDNEQLIHEAVHEGVAFEEDNRTVYQLLKNCALETPAWEWIRSMDGRQNGRQAMIALRLHYDGPGEIEKRLAQAKKQLSDIHYRTEQTFPFESYITKLKSSFEVLEECNEAYTERNKVSILLDRIQSNNTQIQAAKTTIRMSNELKADFNAAANCLSEIVATVFPAVQVKYGRQISSVNTSGRGGGRFGGRGNRPGRGGGYRNTSPKAFTQKVVNGVNISDPTRNFTPQEWDSLTNDAKNHIRNVRNAKKKQAPSNHKRKANAVDVQPTEHEGNDADPAPSAATSNEHVAKPSFGKSAYKRNTSGVISSCRVIASARTNADWVHGEIQVSKCEIDNHADTCCLGSNFVPLYFTGQQCEVQPFLDKYNSVKGVPVCTAVTAYDDEETGLTYLLEFNECLWMGNDLKHSLINPNQIRSSGISLSDDPYDKNRALGFTDPETDKLFPFKVSGNVIYLLTRTPTNDEINNCTRRIQMTSEAPWDPHADLNPAVIANINVEQQGDNKRNNIDIDSVFDFAIVNYHETQSISSLDTKRHSQITPETLAEKWRIGLETARNTLTATTQMGIRHAVHPLRRRYRTDILALRYPRLKSIFYTDTLITRSKSLAGCKVAQVYCNEDLIRVYPIESRKDIGKTLQNFVEDVGVPDELVFDGAAEQTGKNTEFQSNARYFKIKLRQTEAATPRQNRAELAIRELKKRWRDRVVRLKVPTRLWDYALVYESEIMSRMARGALKRTGIERITGNTPDISEWLDFGFYDYVWYWDNTAKAIDTNPLLGRWLGVAHRVGSDMCYWILTSSCKVVARTTVQHVTILDSQLPEIQEKLTSFDTVINDKLNDADYHDQPSTDFPHLEDMLTVYEHDEETDNENCNGNNDDQPTADSYDSIVSAEFVIPRGGTPMKARVTKRAKDNNGLPIGKQDPNPLLDTRMYDVLFEDGSADRLLMNNIASNIYSQVDANGNQYKLLEEIRDHIEPKPEQDLSKGTNPRKSWRFNVLWKDGSSDWVSLSSLKDSNPIELAEYLSMHHLDQHPSFETWLPKVLRLQRRIVSGAYARVSSQRTGKKYWQTQYKFGIKVPRTVQEAFQLDRDSNTTFWIDAIRKEMSNVRIAFEEWKEGTIEDIKDKSKLVGYQQIKCHLIFDIRMDFTRKARFVAGGHTTETPPSLTYSSVVSRESVRIALLISALHELDVCAADVGNAYLNAPCREKIFTIAGPEFQSEVGKVMIIKRALYGLKSSGAAWRNMLASSLMDMGYKSSLADADVWTKPNIKPDGFEYYEMILVYVDDILVVSHDTSVTMKKLAELYRLKPESVGPPTRYLGATTERVQLNDGREVWSMSAKDYITNAVKIVEARMLTDKVRSFNKRQRKRPYHHKYKPELDVSKELEPEQVTWYQQLIGMLRWICELGRIDILYEVSKLSSHNAMPREGHLLAAYNVFAYLGTDSSKKLVFDNRRVDVNPECFTQSSWSDFYPEADTKLPSNMLPARGSPVKITCFVDADHAGDLCTRRSHTGIIIFINNAPIVWYSKRQNTVETSTFGSEFVAMRIAVEQCEALRYKLLMFGIALDGPIDILGDNNSVKKNSSLPQSVLSKKHTSICYHRVRESVAAGIIQIAKVHTDDNLADVLTKCLTNDVRNRHLESILSD